MQLVRDRAHAHTLSNAMKSAEPSEAREESEFSDATLYRHAIAAFINEWG